MEQSHIVGAKVGVGDLGIGTVDGTLLILLIHMNYLIKSNASVSQWRTKEVHLNKSVSWAHYYYRSICFTRNNWSIIFIGLRRNVDEMLRNWRGEFEPNI